jgi:hypothetical protein
MAARCSSVMHHPEFLLDTNTNLILSLHSYRFVLLT